MRISVIPNGVDTTKFKPMNRKRIVEWFERRFCDLDDDLNVLYVGRFSEEKGVVYLIKSLNYLDKGRLFLVGSGPQEPMLKDVARKFKDRVYFLGRVKHDDMPMVYNAMDVFVLPSLTEGFPNSMLEALACGLPVVVTPVGAIPEVVRPEMGVIVELRNAKAIAEGIGKVRDLNRKKIHSIVRANYSFEVVAGRIYGLYSEVLGYPPNDICFASLFAPPYELSGVGMQVFELSKALAKRCRVKILCGIGGDKELDNIGFIKVKCLNGLLSRPTYSITGIVKIVGKYRFDVVDGRNWEGGLIALASKKKGSRAIMSLRGEGAIGRALWKRSINRFIMQRVDCVTVTDKRTAKMAKDLIMNG